MRQCAANVRFRKQSGRRICSDPKRTLNVEIKVELVRVRPQRDGINLVLPLVADPSLDDILGEHITTEQKRMIGLECIERLLQRAGRGLHHLRFRGR